MSEVISMDEKKEKRLAVEMAREFYRRRGYKCTEAKKIDTKDGYNRGFYIRMKGRNYAVLACVNQQRNRKDTFCLTDAERYFLSKDSDRVYFVQDIDGESEKHYEIYANDLELAQADIDPDAVFKVYRSDVMYPAES